MSGLALGSWAASRVLDRLAAAGKTPDLVRLYGILEGVIGVYGALFPFALRLLARAYPLAAAIEPELSLHLLEFIASALLMLPATMLMGATLPIIGSWAIGGRQARIIPDVSALYGLNTFGAMTGCLFAQFLGIKHLGVGGTTWIAVGLNLAVPVLCFTLAPRGDTAPGKTPAARGPRENNRQEEIVPRGLSVLMLVIFAYSGMASLASEILWTRVLVFPLGSTLYSFALILAVFLLGIALGSALADKVLGDSRLAFKFLVVELAIGVVCIAMLPAFDHMLAWTAWADRIFYDQDNTPSRTLLVRSLFAGGLMLPPTLGFGLLFPLANRVHLSLFGTVGGTLGNIYAVNTVGAVAGTVAAPFFLIPLAGIRFSIFVVYAALIVLSCIGLSMYHRGNPARSALAPLFAAILVFSGYAYSTPGISTERPGNHNLSRVEIHDRVEKTRLLDYREGSFATLSVTEDMESGARTLYIDGFSAATASDSIGGSAYMQAMGFIPMALHPNPKRALVIGFGTGSTLGTVSLFPRVTADGVELDRNVVAFAKWFAKWNNNVVRNPGVRLIFRDGRSFVQSTDKTYDVITLEPMSPVQAGVTNLYSREFYEHAARRLDDGGIMMQWLPLHLVGPDDARTIVKTFQEVFPHTSVWNSFLTRIVLLVGGKQPAVLDKNRFDALLQDARLAKTAAGMGLRDFIDFMDFYLTDGEPLKPFLASTPVVTDDRPLLEFSRVALLPPFQWQTDESFLNLLRHRANRLPPVKNVDPLELAEYRRAYEIRTAQRLAIFAQRYRGPGEQAFAAKNHLAALEQMRIYLENNRNAEIRLEKDRWRP
jgi:spermidine synthase